MNCKELLKSLLGGLDQENQLEDKQVHVSLEPKKNIAKVFVKAKGKTQCFEIKAKLI